LAEVLGRAVSWDTFTRTVHVLAVYPDVKIVIGQKALAGFIKDNTAYASVRAICEALGYKVIWDERTRTIIIE